MTFEEAKKILKSEGFEPERFLGVLVEDVKAASWEKIEVSEAMKVVAENGYFPFMEGSKYKERKARLEKEYEKNTKAPGSAENRIKEDSGVNPALAESATQFNDALLNEQGKKIKRLGKEIARLNKIIHKKNFKIEELRKESSRHLRGKMKMFGENFDLEQELKDKDAVLADVAEELRLTKIREKNLTELCQKYIKANEELKEKLANNVVDKIDAQALKSAESALAWKEKLIYYKDMAIADLRKELKAQKGLVNHISKKYDGAKINLNLRMKECEKLEEALEEKTKLVEIVRKGSKEYCEYGIAAEKMIQKMAKDIVNDRPVSPKDYEQYRLWAKGYRFNPQLPERTDEEEKKLNTAKSTLDDLKEEAYNSFNAKAHNLGPVGSNDGNGIIDQMVGVDIAEEGGDHSAIIAQCYKNIAISKDEAEIIERCTKNGTELHYSEKDGFTYTNVFGDEIPIICLRGMCQVFTDEEIKNMKK